MHTCRKQPQITWVRWFSLILLADSWVWHGHPTLIPWLVEVAHRDQQPQLQHKYLQTRLIIVAILSSHLHKAWEQRFPRGRTLRTAADTYRSRGVPWLLLLWVVTGDRIAAACLRSPELLDSPGVGSHCGQSAPIAYGSVCRETDPNQASQGTAMPKLTFLRSKSCDRCPALREATAPCSSRGTETFQKMKQCHCVSTRWHSSHSPSTATSATSAPAWPCHDPRQQQDYCSEWITGLELQVLSSLLHPTWVPLILVPLWGEKNINSIFSSTWLSAL